MNTATGLVERHVVIEGEAGRLRGDLVLPAEPKGCVLLLHGHTGNRDEIPIAGGAGLFAHAAMALGQAGYASLRIDFLGSGESDGFWADTTLETQAADAIRASHWLSAQPPLAGCPRAVLGFSQGGLVALLAAPRVSLGAAVVWNPVFEPARSYTLIYGADAMQAAQDADPDLVLPQAGGLRARFFQDTFAQSALSLGADMPLPLLIVVSEADHLIPEGPSLAARLAQRRHHVTETLVLAAGHDLGAATGVEGPDWVIGRSIAFLGTHLR